MKEKSQYVLMGDVQREVLCSAVRFIWCCSGAATGERWAGRWQQETENSVYGRKKIDKKPSYKYSRTFNIVLS